jgi:hypothetical protein
MKRYGLLILLSFIITNVNCQEKKNQPTNNPYKVNIGAGMGISRFQLDAHDTQSSQTIPMFDNTIDVVRFQLDYSFFKRFSMGLAYEACGLFIDLKETSSGNSYSFSSVLSTKIGISAKYKFISKEKNHLYIEIMPVYSWMNFKYYSESLAMKYYISNIGFQTALGWDHFFGKHIGINLRSSYTTITYKTNPDYKIISNPYNIPDEYLKTLFGDIVHKSYGSTIGLLFRF